MRTVHHRTVSGAAGRLLFILVWIGGNLSGGAAPVAAGRPPVPQPAADLRPAAQAQPPAQPLDPLDLPPAADARVVDVQNPAWVTYYGTERGRQLFPPRHPAFEAPPPAAPSSPVGQWQDFQVSSGSGTVTDIAALSDGSLAVGVLNAGVWLWSAGPAGAYSWRLLNHWNTGGGLPYDDVQTLAAVGNELWVGTGSGGISVLNLSTQAWRQYNTGNGMPGNGVLRLRVATGILLPEVWAATTAGAVRFSAGLPPNPGYTLTIYNTANGLPENTVSDILRQPNGNVWFATTNYLVMYNLTSQRWTPYDHTNTGACGMDTAPYMARTLDDAVWFMARVYHPNSPSRAPDVLTDLGLCQYYNGAWVLFPSANLGYPGGQPSGLAVDAAGRLWAGFSGAGNAGGVLLWEPSGCGGEGSTIQFHPSDSPATVRSNAVSAVAAVGDAVWIGYQNQTLWLTRSVLNWHDYTPLALGSASASPGPLLLTASAVYAGLGVGLSTWNGTSWNYAPVYTNTAGVSALALAPDGSLMVGTAGGGVWYRKLLNNLPFWTHYSAADGLPSNIIMALAYDHQGRLWVAALGGLALLDHGYWTAFTPDQYPLPSATLTALAVDAQDRIWAGTSGSGLVRFDPAAGGAGAWQTFTTVDGLRSNTISALAAEPGGALLAGTPSGISRRDPLSGAWSPVPITNMPDLKVYELAPLPDGRLWAATAKGLALYRGGKWTGWGAPHSTLETAQVIHVASDGSQTWSSTYAGGVSVRAESVPPVGYCQPVITGFSPLRPTTEDTVTISGNYFDDRPGQVKITIDPEYNMDFETNLPPDTASLTSLTFKPPVTTVNGYLIVTAHNRASAAYQVNKLVITPRITGVSRSGCVSVGDELLVVGSGFTSTGVQGKMQVAFGSQAFGSQPVDARDATSMRMLLRPASAPGGTLQVRAGETIADPLATFATNFQIAYPIPNLDHTVFQQGVEGETLIWGKRTLVRLALDSSLPACPAHVDAGYLNWLYNQDGEEPGSSGLGLVSPAGLWVFGTSLSKPPSIFTANLVASFDNWFTTPWFSLADFRGMRVHLSNHGIPVLNVAGNDYIDIPASRVHFYDYGDTGATPLDLLMVPIGNDATDWNAFDAKYAAEIQETARAFPQQDYDPDYGDNRWMLRPEINFSWDEPTVIIKEGVDDFSQIQDMVDDYFDEWNDGADENGHKRKNRGVAIIDGALDGGNNGKSGSSTPCWNGIPWGFGTPLMGCGSPVVAVFNYLSGSPTIGSNVIHEVTHTSVWVDPSSPNHAFWNFHHSKFDEGKLLGSKCIPGLNFASAMSLAQGPTIGRVVYLPEGWSHADLLHEFAMTTCDEPGNMPKSIMTYVPGIAGNDSFLEPLDYRHVVASLPLALQGQAELQARRAQGAPAADLSLLPSAQRFLRIAGSIGAGDVISVTLSRFVSSLRSEGAGLPGQPYRLALRDAAGQPLASQTFDPAKVTGDGEQLSRGRFNLKLPAPVGVAQAQIWHNSTLLWQASVSPNAPTVLITSPSGGTFDGAGSIPVTWSARDQDGDKLDFALDYSSDDGQNWDPIATHLSGGSFTWKPSYAMPSTTARLRLRASDGFNTGSNVSARFTLTARPPLAVITSPKNGQTVTEGAPVALNGSSLTSRGSHQGTFSWKVDNVTAGSNPGLSYTFSKIGDHTVKLQVTSDGLTGEASLLVHVVKDYDHDGLPNDWEQRYGFNPLSPLDAYQDPDGDTLTNFQEYGLGTDPLVSDTDSDGVSDGAEAADHTDPHNNASKPPGVKTLSVGSSDLTFTYYRGGALPAPVGFWVNATGPSGYWGWLAGADQPFIHTQGGPSGTAAQLSVSVDPSNLAAGEYSGHVTISATDGTNPIAGSPVTLQVKLVVLNLPGNPLFFPLLTRQ